MSRGSFRHVLLFMLLAIGCNGPDTSGVRMIGHGGQGVNGPHPMNGREALLGGLADGAYGIEMDVRVRRRMVSWSPTMSRNFVVAAHVPAW
ncbi:MAG: hypothetical protein R2818_10325 [Flavobacteriales bacterium]